MSIFDELTNRLLAISEDPYELTSEEIEECLDGKELAASYFKGTSSFSSGKGLVKAINKGGFRVEELLLLDTKNRNFVLLLEKDESLLDGCHEESFFNKDLPIEEIEFDENNVVKINRHNAEKIKEVVREHHRYKYTSFVNRAFTSTVHENPEDLTLDDVVLRLVCIDNIDGTNLSKSSVKETYAAFAQSILEAGLEQKIKDGMQIDDGTFKAIAKRSAITGTKNKCFFSAITKYIARTAFYCYGISDGYPIYDDVLRNHLYLYISDFTPSVISSLKNNCKYKEYCEKINGFLTQLNSRLPEESEPITNLEFDQIVWFSYKTANAEPKYK